MKQFEHSIQTIASSVASINPMRAAANIVAAEEKLNKLHAKISHVDQTVASYASNHMRNYSFQDKEMAPDEIAKIVLEQAEDHQWFDDEPPERPEEKLPFNDEDINALRCARMRVGDDIVYVGLSLPSPDVLPALTDLIGLHQDLIRAKSIDTSVTQGNVLALVDSRLETFEKAQALATFLDQRFSLMTKLAGSQQSWLDTFSKRIAEMQATDPVLKALLKVCADVRRLDVQRRELVAKAVEVPVDAESNEDVVDAIERLLVGKSAFALPFGKGETRKLLAAVRVTGSPPSSAEDWKSVQELLMWRTEARKALARWSSLSAEFGLEAATDGLDVDLRKVAHWQDSIEGVLQLTFDFETELHPRMAEVFGKTVADRMWNGGETFVALASSSLQAHVDKERLAYATKRVQEIVCKLDGHSGDIVDKLHSFFVGSLGSATTDESGLQMMWSTLHAKLARLTALRPDLDEVSRVGAALQAAGAIKWGERVQTQRSSPDHDPFTPINWLEAWNWRQALMFLDRIDVHHKLRELFDERKVLTTTLARTYQEIVAEKTWLGVFNNSPDLVRQALQTYLNSVHAMGSGTGVRAIRHRKTAREAMQRAYLAVPCWVLPQWRVSETIPPEIGLFDLVIIDEASQSDIWALPALLRGKKVLVVGDHKQVSPSAIGTAEEKVKDLVNRFLGNQPHGSQMTPDKSIYDLARVVFAGNSVMLKEHFRCVPAIIEFSNREFYEGDIRPLRLPKSNDRLDPPLVDVFVKGGFRKGDVNEPEAKALVDEIESILTTPQFEARTIGVVTLLGTTQAALIHKMVSERISPVDIVARKISIGPPPVFQGRERDIMLVSMVVGSGDRAAANRADIQQRFNVALSRARDRMYLFRSVTETEFREDSLNGKVIRHFKQPFRQDIKKVQTLRQKCESGFELEMFDELVKRGFRVDPQVPCGGYRIDFVVEGTEGRRLAIECDGDRFHGPGQWQDDMARQRVLERAGWTFWRCFASSFVRRRQTVLDDLMQTLYRLGIEPLGSETVDSTLWVHYKEVDPYCVEEETEDA